MKNNKQDDMVLCPMIDRKIDRGECLENQCVVDGMIKESSLPKEYTCVKDWREICRRCRYYKESE